jgi:hypothetical protein
VKRAAVLGDQADDGFDLSDVARNLDIERDVGGRHRIEQTVVGNASGAGKRNVSKPAAF